MIVDFLNKKKYFFVGCGILIGIIAINLFPEGYVSVDGDVSQFIPTRENLINIFYEWQGRSIIFYSLFYLFSNLGISMHAQLSLYLVLFIFGSYVSFYAFLSLITKMTEKYMAIFSLLYVFNFFTLYVFQSVFGYSSYYLIYVFIPILVGLYLKFIKTGNRIYAMGLFLAMLLSSASFSNPAYALSCIIFFTVFSVALCIATEITLDKKIIMRSLVVSVMFLAANSYWIIPLFPSISPGLEVLKDINHPLRLNWWVFESSNPMLHTLGMMHDDYRDFPRASPYGPRGIFQFLSIIPIGIALLYLGYRKNENRKILVALLFTLAVFILLVIKTNDPFGIVNYYVYNLWGFSTLRAYEKTAIFIPFLIMAIFTLIIGSNNKYKNKLFILVFIVILTPLPFFTGDIHKKEKSKFLSKIPTEYYEIRNIINTDKEKSSLAVLPHNEDSGFGWSNYPKWNMHGVDITLSLYNKQGINPNYFYFENWMAAKEFSDDSGIEQGWIVKLLGLMNAKYILYHKDVSPETLLKTADKMKVLEERGMIRKITDNEYFTLYQINNNFVVPYISWQQNDVKIESSSESIEANFAAVKNTLQAADFEENNPKKYTVKINEASGGDIILAEPYRENWKAYYIDKQGKETELQNHFMARGYANGWKVCGDESEKLSSCDDISKIIIEYYPIRLMWRGIAISILSLSVIIILLIKHLYAKRKHLG